MSHRGPALLRIPEETLGILQDRARKATASHRVVLRARIILLAHQGCSVAATARKLGCAENTVRTWSRRFAEDGLEGLRDHPRPGHPRRYGIEARVTILSLACSPPEERGFPLSRYSIRDLTEAVAQELHGTPGQDSPGKTTVHHILKEAALRPWTVHHWKHALDPQFGPKAARILDLYHRQWEGNPLGPDDVVLSLDEKTCIQAFRRLQRTTPPEPGQPIRIQFEYERLGVVLYVAALDMATGKVMGDLVEANNKVSFLAFLEKLLGQEPCRSARRVFLVMDNGSAHDPRTFPAVVAARWPQVTVTYTPTHGSWLNAIEQYFGGLQRKALHPNDFATIEALKARILGFERWHNQKARAPRWDWTVEEMREWLSEREMKQGLNLGSALIPA
jgi:hypothetical protein